MWWVVLLIISGLTMVTSAMTLAWAFATLQVDNPTGIERTGWIFYGLCSFISMVTATCMFVIAGSMLA